VALAQFFKILKMLKFSPKKFVQKNTIAQGQPEHMFAE
jgi:hypothetical protein